MTPSAYRKLLDHIGLGIMAAGEAFGYSKRTGRRFAVNGPPASVAILVRLLYAGKITLSDVAGALRPEDRR